MDIKAINMSLSDYPGHSALTVFVGKCNMRCPWCFNADLALDDLENLKCKEDVFGFITKRKKIINGICISGGEPTLQEGLADFLFKIKEAGLDTKINSNGTNPAVLKNLKDKKLLDYIAVDIKAPPEKYREATGVDCDIKAIYESACLANEIRITAHPGITVSDVKKIKAWVDHPKIVLQAFHPGEVLGDRIGTPVGTTFIGSEEAIFLEKEIGIKTWGFN